MIFTAPVPFREALSSRAVKRVMPTHLSSADLLRLSVQVRERAMFSARVMNEEFLRRASSVVDRILDPKPALAADGTPVLRGLDEAAARLELKQFLQSIGYQPAEEDRGTIKDLSTDQRLNLIIRTNRQMAEGYGYWEQGMDPAVLEAFPCAELVRIEDRQEKRNWYERWRAAGGKIYAGRPEGPPLVEGLEGRCIARKDDPVWAALSTFGQPYPPFDFNSGVDMADVPREDAEALGVITREDVVTPQSRGFEMEVAE